MNPTAPYLRLVQPQSLPPPSPTMPDKDRAVSETVEEKRRAMRILDYIQYDGLHKHTTFVFDTLIREIRAAVEAEREEWYGLVSTMMKSLPWGALKGALLEDSRVKAAIRQKPEEGEDG